MSSQRKSRRQAPSVNINETNTHPTAPKRRQVPSNISENIAPPTVALAPETDGHDLSHDDDDCILMVEEVETIDLCNLSQDLLRQFRNPVHNEVIVVQDSPVTRQTSAKRAAKSPNEVAGQLSLEAKPDDNANSVEINCPICLESVFKRDPVSTVCGHVFCKHCITESLKIVKKCPMCKRSLSAKNSYHDIFLGA